MKMEQTTYEDGIQCSETSAHKIQAPGNHPKERIQHIGPVNLATLEGGSCTKNMTSTEGCGYSFVY